MQGTEVCNTSYLNVANEAVEENNNSNGIAAAFDVSWQKHGHTSLNGVITTTSSDMGKVLDFECVTKYCNILYKQFSVTQHFSCLGTHNFLLKHASLEFFFMFVS